MKQQSSMLYKYIFAILVATPMLFMTNVSQAMTLSFFNITNNSDYDVSSQLRAVVNDEGNNEVSFTFFNDIGIQSNISEIYFDYGSNNNLIDKIGITGYTTGVNFTDDPSAVDPGNLPGAKNAIGFRSDYGADSISPESKNGIDHYGEYLTFTAALTSGFGYSDLLTALYNDFQIGLHMTAFADGESDSYASASVVPLPGAVWLFGSALLGFIGISRRNKKE